MMKTKKFGMLFGCITLYILLGCVQAEKNDGSETVFSSYNVRQFGAVGDGTTLNSSAIQAAVDLCSKNGGGRVVIPAGTWLTGTILMKDNVELHLEHGSTLLGSKRHEDYARQPTPKFRSHKDIGGFYAIIYAEGANNIAVTGSGTIDGQGKYQEPRYGGGDQDGRPRNIVFVSCRDIRIEGIRMRNSGTWNQHYLDCDNVIVRGVDVYNHSNRNNDAIDIDGCRRVTVSDCHFDTDDDGITLKSTGAAPTEDVVITNCTVSSFCNAIKAGTESSGGFRNITISNCVVTPSRSKNKPIFGTPAGGITGISLIIVDGGIMENITIDNIVIDGPVAPIYIRLGNRARKYTEGIPTPEIGKVRNIAISNVVARSHGNYGSSITGLPGHYVENISLSNIQLFSKGNITANDFRVKVSEDEKGYPQPTAWGNLPAFGLFLRHVRGITLDGVMMGVEEPDVRSPVWVDDVQQLSIKQTRLSGPIGKGPFVKGVSLTDYDIEPPLGWKGKADELIQILDTSQPRETTLIVAADGSGQFKTVQAAVDSIPSGNKQRIIIFIKNGDYPDQIRVNRSFLTLRGEDRKKTRLCAEVDSPRRHQDKDPQRSWATVEVDAANDVTFENLTITNPFRGRGYAVALSSINNATRLSVIDCDLTSKGGDTVSPWSRGLYYFRNCLFSGTYHFFGTRGTCYVTDCQFWCLGSDVSLFNEGIYDETDKLVIRNSTFDGPEPFGLGSYFRDAAWYFIDCKFSDKLKADGRIFRRTFDNYTPKWGENRIYYADCKGPDYPWLKDNITASPAKTKDTATAQWTLRGWKPNTSQE